ncbi:hypothetical protein ACA910_014702 [Epithemia clementina (nom. ined.)]
MWSRRINALSLLNFSSALIAGSFANAGSHVAKNNIKVPPRPYLRSLQDVDSTPSPSVSTMPSSTVEPSLPEVDSTPSPSVSTMPSSAVEVSSQGIDSTPSPSVSSMPSLGDDVDGDAIPCGSTSCLAEEVCCSESCGVCTKPGEACTDQDCSA